MAPRSPTLLQGLSNETALEINTAKVIFPLYRELPLWRSYSRWSEGNLQSIPEFDRIIGQLVEKSFVLAMHVREHSGSLVCARCANVPAILA